MFFKKLASYLTYFVFLTPLVFYPLGVEMFEVPQQTFFVGLICLILLVGVLGFLFGKKFSIVYHKNIALVFAAVALSLCLSTVFSISPIESFYGSMERGQGLFIQIFYLLVFLLFVHLLQKEDARDTSLTMVCAVGTLLSVFAILQVFGLDVTGINNLDSMSGRPFATLGQPNFLGQFLLVSILGIHYVLQKKGVVKNDRYLLIGVLVVNYVALVLTQNKASFLGLAVALFLLFVAKKLKKTYLVIGLLLITLLSGGLILSTRSLSSRLFAWSSAAMSIIERPVFGHGQETYYISAQQHLDPKVYWYEDLYTLPDHVHNFVLQTLHDYGLVGFLVMGFAVWFIVSAYKANRTDENTFPFLALLASAVSLLFGFSMTANIVVLCYLLALFVVTTFPFQRFDLKNVWFKITAIPVVICFVCFSMNQQILNFTANASFASMLQNLIMNQPLAQKEFHSIVEMNPPYSFIHYSLIHLNSLHYTADLDLSLQSLGRITGKNFHYYIASARVFHAQHDMQSAYGELEKAALLAPNFTLIHQLWGEYAFENEDYSGAIVHLEKVLELAPPFWRKDYSKDHVTSEQSRIFMKNHPEFVSVVSMLAEAYNRSGQKNRAMDIMSSVSLPVF
jgi:O-antigen ligase